MEWRQREDMGEHCGMDLFDDFEFDDIRTAKPPKKKGVYVIKVTKRGMDPDELIRTIMPHISRLGWKLAQKYVLNRIGRIRKITECPVLYFGSAGTTKGSKETLAVCYQDLIERHPAQYPIWALLYGGWELEFGWKVTEDPKDEEAELKRKYKDRQQGKLPALVSR